MSRFVSRLVTTAGLVLLVATLIPSATEASPVKAGSAAGGKIVIKGPIDCERQKVQRCGWVGKTYICVWVDGPCAVY